MLSSFEMPRTDQTAWTSQHCQRPRCGKEKLQSVLDEATKARAKSIQLKGTQFADELSNKLLKHANQMENLYADLKQKVSQKKPVDSEIETVLAKIARKQEWYTKAEASFFFWPNQDLIWNNCELFQCLWEKSNRKRIRLCRNPFRHQRQESYED